MRKPVLCIFCGEWYVDYVPVLRNLVGGCIKPLCRMEAQTPVLDEKLGWAMTALNPGTSWQSQGAVSGGWEL